MGNSEMPEVGNDLSPTEKPSVISKVVSVFYRPSALFRAPFGKWEWLIPLIITVVIIFITGIFVFAAVADEQSAVFKERLDNFRNYMTEEQYNEALNNIEEGFSSSKNFQIKWYDPLRTVAAYLVFLLIPALIYMAVGNFILGGRASFWMILNVVAYSTLISVAGNIIRSLMAIGKESLYVFTGLGFLRPMVGDDSFLFYLFRQVDIFTIWKLAAICIGLGVIYRIKAKKFAYFVYPIWILFLLLVAAGDLFMLGGLGLMLGV